MQTGTAVSTLAAVVLVVGAGTAHAGFDIVPLPGSLNLVLTGIVGLAAAGWWLRRK